MATKLHHYSSPIGDLIIGSIDDSLCLCAWADDPHLSNKIKQIERHTKTRTEEGSSVVIEMTESQLDEYFAGKRKRFDIKITLTGTEFQITVRRALLNIPYGKTSTYSRLAQQIGRPKAVRAVANANASNPISIIIPCHRIIGSDNSLTGYAGGLETKQFLLNLESANQLKLNP